MAFKSERQRRAVMAKMKPKGSRVKSKTGPKKQKWFKKAVEEKPPYTLGGWKKTLSAKKRRKLALQSRPKNWSLKEKQLSASRALQALANVSKEKSTKAIAKKDADYFRKKYKE